MEAVNKGPGAAAAGSEMEFALVGLPPVPAVDSKPVEAKPAVRWLTEKKRVESYTLEHPFAIGGVEYRTVEVRRMTAGQVEEFAVALQVAGKSRYPLFFVGDAEIPDAAWTAMDDDDRLALGEIAHDFLPARFRPAKD